MGVGMNTFSLAVSMLSGAAPAAVQSDRGATAKARRLIAGGGEWCADDLVCRLKINRKTAHAILKRAAAKGFVVPVRAERVIEMRNTQRTRTYYRAA